MINDIKKLNTLDRIALVFLATGILFCSYASLVEPFQLKISRWAIKTEKWKNSENLKIAVLTDLHMIWPWMTQQHLQKIVEETNKLNPDIVVLLGDYVGTHPFGLQINPDDGLLPLKNLSPACGVFAVIGNHDLHPRGQWPPAIIRAGIPLLRNQSLPIKCKDKQFWISGLDDLWYAQPDIKGTLAQVTDENPVIMLIHNPDLFHDMPQSVALSLAGHTHGGQVRFPFIGSVSAVIPSDYGDRYAYGHINENGKDLVVSSGLGMTALPIRFLNVPEISLITLTNANSP